MTSREEALAIVREHVKNESLVRHMLAVESAMRSYAAHLKGDEELWGLAGLLHDFDWEIHPSLEQHPQDGAPILSARGVPEEIVRAILSHANHTGVPRETSMQKALYACDEITGLITAVALVRPSKSIHDVKVKSIKKKWKDKSFAAGTRRDEMEEAASEFGVELWKHAENVLVAMQSIAPALGLEGI
ncbi:MAG: HDIG domain-containing protein [Chloroflexi bacterium]|nr:HDIG domain-containing protein [Chloroflexota bacterium]MQC26025.1 HDIG domain-containing protein [Chloroflexota bacterium]